MTRGLGLLRWALLLLATLFTLTPSAPAQDILREAGPLAFPITTTSLRDLARNLNLDRAQLQQAHELYDGYRAAIHAAVKAAADEFEAEEKKTPDQGLTMKVRQRVISGFASKARELEASLLADVESLLTEPQRPLMAHARAARDRERSSRFAFTAREAPDLGRLLTTIKVNPDANPALREAMAEYDRWTTTAVASKDKAVADAFAGTAKLDHGDEEEKLIADLVRPLIELSLRQGEDNLRHLRAFQAALPEPDQAALQEAFYHAAYPRVYTYHPVADRLKKLRTIDLTPEQQAEIDLVASDYDRDAIPANRRWADAVSKVQQDLPETFLKLLQDRDVAGRYPGLEEARRGRLDLDKRTLDRLSRVLNKSQAEALKDPNPPEVPDITEDLMPNFDAMETPDDWDSREPE